MLAEKEGAGGFRGAERMWTGARQMVTWKTEEDLAEARARIEAREVKDRLQLANKKSAEETTLEQVGEAVKAEKNNPRKDGFDLLSDFDKDFDFSEVFTRNKLWADTKRAMDPDFFNKLAKGQSPSILWIGCSDARVPANLLIGADSGAVFVHRNIANQVLAIDVNAQSVLQYAIEFLHVPHIVVCGHYDCGGVRAALRNMNHGSPLENWLRNIRDVWRLHYDEIEKVPEGEPRARRLIELNVIDRGIDRQIDASIYISLYRDS
jgi:carbonic anhydrase